MRDEVHILNPVFCRKDSARIARGPAPVSWQQTLLAMTWTGFGQSHWWPHGGGADAGNGSHDSAPCGLGFSQERVELSRDLAHSALCSLSRTTSLAR